MIWDLVHECCTLLISNFQKISTRCVQLHERVVEDGCNDKAARIQSVGLLHRVPKRAQVVTTTHSDSVAIVHVALLDVVWQEEEFFDLLLLGDRQRDRHHGVESDTDSVTLGAAKRTLKLTVKQVCDD